MALKILEKKGSDLRSFGNGILVRRGIAKDIKTACKHCRYLTIFFLTEVGVCNSEITLHVYYD